MRLISGNNLQHIDWNWLKDPNSEMYKEVETRNIWFREGMKANQTVIEKLRKDARILIALIENK